MKNIFKIRKTTTAIVFAVMLAALVLNACAGGAAPAPAGDKAEPAGDKSGTPVVVTHWQHTYEARDAIIKDLAAQFNAENPDVQVQVESLPYSAYFEKLGSTLEAGSGPDVFTLPSNQVTEFQQRGQMAAVPESVMPVAEIEKAFLSSTLSQLKKDGKYYGFPTDVQTYVLLYNDSLFEEAGLDPSKDFETWEEMRDAAIKLTKFDGDAMIQSGLTMTIEPYLWYWNQPNLLDDRGSVDEETLKVTWNTPEGEKMWQFFTDLVKKDKVDAVDFLAETDKFIAGKAAMKFSLYVDAGNMLLQAPDVKLSLHLAPPPPGRPKATTNTSWAYVVSNQSKHPEAAWKWAEFITSEAAQRKWIAGRGELPSRVALLDDASVQTDPIVKAGFATLPLAKAYDIIGWDDVWYIHQGIWDDIVVNNMPVAEAMQKGADAEEKLYQEKLGK